MSQIIQHQGICPIVDGIQVDVGGSGVVGVHVGHAGKPSEVQMIIAYNHDVVIATVAWTIFDVFDLYKIVQLYFVNGHAKLACLLSPSKVQYRMYSPQRKGLDLAQHSRPILLKLKKAFDHVKSATNDRTGVRDSAKSKSRLYAWSVFGDPDPFVRFSQNAFNTNQTVHPSRGCVFLNACDCIHCCLLECNTERRWDIRDMHEVLNRGLIAKPLIRSSSQTLFSSLMW